MRKVLIPIFIISIVFLFNNCEEEEDSFESKILGNWIVVDNDLKPSVTEWGLFYVSSVKFYRDNSFTLNLGTGVDVNISKAGTWKLENNSSSITFYSEVEDAGKIYRDTTQFDIKLISGDVLVLKNDWITIRHKKSNN